MSAINRSAGKIVKHLLAKEGPMSTQQLYKFVPTYQEQFISKSHLKTKILKSLEANGDIEKKIFRDPSLSKPTWQWKFTKPEDAELYKNF